MKLPGRVEFEFSTEGAVLEETFDFFYFINFAEVLFEAFASSFSL